MEDYSKSFEAILAHEIMLGGMDILIEMAKKHDGYIKSIRTSKESGEKWEIIVRRVDNEGGN